tara:strand:- start:407 stop:718 length:312 start_codon:yes stop_codon:yes gene_type:complete
MNAAHMLVDNGFICEDVVKHVLVDFLIECKAHWKNIFNICIIELSEEIDNGIWCEAHDFSENYPEDDFWMAEEEVKDQKDYINRILPYIMKYIKKSEARRIYG